MSSSSITRVTVQAAHTAHRRRRRLGALGATYLQLDEDGRESGVAVVAVRGKNNHSRHAGDVLAAQAQILHHFGGEVLTLRTQHQEAPWDPPCHAIRAPASTGAIPSRIPPTTPHQGRVPLLVLGQEALDGDLQEEAPCRWRELGPEDVAAALADHRDADALGVREGLQHIRLVVGAAKDELGLAVLGLHPDANDLAHPAQVPWPVREGRERRFHCPALAGKRARRAGSDAFTVLQWQGSTQRCAALLSVCTYHVPHVRLSSSFLACRKVTCLANSATFSEAAQAWSQTSLGSNVASSTAADVA